MKKFLFLTLFSSWLLCACGNEKVQEQNDGAVSVTTEATPGFEVFFEQFKTDTAFQIEHIVFPLSYQYLDFGIDEMETMEEQITKAGWVHNSFDMDEYNEIGEGVVSIADGEHGKKIVGVVLMGTGVSLEYVFELTDGAWKLTAFIDGSM